MPGHGNSLATLNERVVQGGYCNGCGLCAALLGPACRMRFDPHGLYRPALTAPGGQAGGGVALWEVCPFGANSAAEDVIAQALFGSACSRHESIGYHAATYAGSVAEGGFRRRGSSGGMASWALCELLRRDRIDAVLHVQPHLPAPSDGRLFRYAASRSIEEVLRGAKSRYYPVEMSQVLRVVREVPSRYAFVGLPCFVKGVRPLCMANPVIAQRIRYCVGLVCGHAKSVRFADMLAWQCGVEPGALRSIDFRVELPERKAWEYGVEVAGLRDGEEFRVVRPNGDLFGCSWAHGLLKNPACDYCDDVFAETADVGLGDAWLEPYTTDSRGVNVVVVRNGELAALIESALADGRLALEHLPPAQVAESQEAGLRHRRDGTAYRLFLKEREGQWHPPKRVQAGGRPLSRRRRRIYELRLRLTAESHVAFVEAVAAGRFDVFRERVTPLITAHDRCYPERKRGQWKLLRKARKSARSVVRRLRPRLRGAPGGDP